MGHKKRPTSAHRKSSPQLPPPPSSEPPLTIETLTATPEIKTECERALSVLRRGNYNKALRLMKEATPKFDNSALFHRVFGTISAKVAGIIDDVNVKQRHLRNAIESAKKAKNLSPNSIEYSHFYANLLFEVSSHVKEYNEVLTECERALSLQNPNDPAKDELSAVTRDETVSFSSKAKEARVSQVQLELRNLVQQVNVASLTSWVKNLSDKAEDAPKFHVLHVPERAAEDPIEARYLSGGNASGRRGNEIKKAVKTPLERRKDVEVRVTAAKLLQQKNELVGEEIGGVGGGVVASGSGSVTPKVGEKRRHGGSKLNISVSEKKEKVKSFWNSMSSEMKRGLLCIRVSDLWAHFERLSTKERGQVCEVLSEALAYGEMNGSWKFWACCRCGERFTDSDSHIHHVIREHLENLSPQLQSVVPQSVDSEWEEMLLNCSWKPLDLISSVRMLENQSKYEASEFSDRETLEEQIDDCWDDSFCTEENWKSCQEKKSLEDNCNGSLWENGCDDGNLNIEFKACDRKEDSKMYNHNNSWPLSDDTERAVLLERISFLFQVLLRQKCLAATLLQKVMHYVVEELQSLSPGSRILSCGVDQTPLCICFLRASPLKKIADFLQTISYSCGFGRYPGNVSLEDTITCPQVLECADKITLNESGSSLQLDESLLRFYNVRDDVGSEFSIDGFGNNGQSDSDPFLSWISAGSPCVEQLPIWSRIREEKSQEGIQLLDMLGKEFNQLQTFCHRKLELLGYEEALQRLHELCLEECNGREQLPDISYCGYESILRKRRDELVEADNEVTLISNRLELDVISSVLKEAESLRVSHYGYEDAYGGVASHLCDLEAGEEDWRSKDIYIILERQKENINTELRKVDAQIMHRVANMNKLELKLESVSILDYRFILLPLVKSFVQAHLDDLAEKEATEKSDAAREAFLAELALDSKKCTSRGHDNGKNTQEKKKDRKTNKDSRRSKDSKFGSFNDQPEADEQSSLAATSDGFPVDSADSNGNTRGLEDEFRRKLELEAEEQKLEETLEFQRQLENEAKQRLLDEQRRRNALIAYNDTLDEAGDCVEISGASCCKQVALPCKDANTDRVRSSPKERHDTCSDVADDESVGSAKRWLKSGLPNFSDASDVGLPFERQAGKRGKQRSSLKVPEEKDQTVSYGKENVKLQNLTTGIVQKGQGWNLKGPSSQSVGDGVSKTLRQLQAEADEEERFQADLKKAVTQSLDSFQQSCQMMPLVSTSSNTHKHSQDVGNFGTEINGASENVQKVDLVGPGLQNEVGEYNCYLNVIIQSLWHLRHFREEFLRRSTSEHVHVGDPCVVCALFDVLTALTMASGDANRKPVNPSAFRIALSSLYPKSNFFLEGQMNDASEVLGVIFESLHQSFTSVPIGSDSDLAESNGKGSWDCFSPACIVHTLFGMDIFERMNCYSCGLESRHLKYTSFFHNTNASALRTVKVISMENSFAELLNSVEMNHQLACDPETHGCGKLNHIHHILSNSPQVFTIVLGWQKTRENLHDIKATLAALSTEIDISILYRGLDPQSPHRLAVVVCYYGQHYHCFAYSRDLEQWIMYDDKTVKVIGSWEDVISMCERGHLQPQVLFYESVNGVVHGRIQEKHLK